MTSTRSTRTTSLGGFLPGLRKKKEELVSDEEESQISYETSSPVTSTKKGLFRNFRSPFRKLSSESLRSSSNEEPAEDHPESEDGRPSLLAAPSNPDLVALEQEEKRSPRRGVRPPKVSDESLNAPEQTPEQSPEQLEYEDPDAKEAAPTVRTVRRHSSTGATEADGRKVIQRKSLTPDDSGRRRRRSLGPGARRRSLRSPATAEEPGEEKKERRRSIKASNSDESIPVSTSESEVEHPESPRKDKRHGERKNHVRSSSDESLQKVAPPSGSESESPSTPSRRKKAETDHDVADEAESPSATTRKSKSVEDAPRTPRRHASSKSSHASPGKHTAPSTPKTPKNDDDEVVVEEILSPSAISPTANSDEEGGASSKLDKKLTKMKKKVKSVDADEQTVNTRLTTNRVKLSKLAVRSEGGDTQSVSAELLAELAKKGKIRVKRTVSAEGVESFDIIEASPRKSTRERRKATVPEASEAEASAATASPRRRTRTPSRARGRSVGRSSSRSEESEEGESRASKSPAVRSQSRGRRVVRAGTEAEAAPRTPRTPARSKSRGRRRVETPGGHSSSSKLHSVPNMDASAPNMEGPVDETDPSTPKASRRQKEVESPRTPTTTKDLKEEVRRHKDLTSTPSPRIKGHKTSRSPSRSPRSPSDSPKKRSPTSGDAKKSLSVKTEKKHADDDDDVVRLSPRHSVSTDSLKAAQLAIPMMSPGAKNNVSVQYDDVTSVYGESMSNVNYDDDEEEEE